MKHLINPRIALMALSVIWSSTAQVKTLWCKPEFLSRGPIYSTGNASGNKNLLFKIQRSKDANEIHYNVRLDTKGLLNPDDPIDIHWVKKDGIESLTGIQKKYAYGLDILSKKPGEINFRFVCYDKRTFTMRRISANTFKVYVSSGGKQIELQRIFMQMDNSSLWSNKVSSIELHGLDPATSNNVTEIIKL